MEVTAAAVVVVTEGESEVEVDIVAAGIVPAVATPGHPTAPLKSSQITRK